MNWAVILLFSFFAVIGVNGHAKLVEPLAWNPNPSTSPPCGGSLSLPTGVSVSQWQIGSVQTVTWTIVVSDGEGLVTIKVDPRGGTNFSQSIAYTGITPNALGPFYFTLTVPSITCTGANGCTIQVRSPNGWNGCASVLFTAAPTTVPPPQPSCETLSGLSYCTMMNGFQAIVPAGQTAAAADNNIQLSYGSNSVNVEVIDDIANPSCPALLKYVLCTNGFPPCAGASTWGCSSICQQMNVTCEMNPTHYLFFGYCTTYPATCAVPMNPSSASHASPAFGVVGLIFALWRFL